MTDKEAMNLALEALMYASYEDIEYTDACAAKVLEARNALKEALAQPEQEPVAWKLMPRDATDAMLKAMDECSTGGYDERLYAGHAASVYMAAWDALDIHPPQRPWAGLTDEEIQTTWDSVMDGAVFTRREVYKAIKAKLKQKNGFDLEKNT